MRVLRARSSIFAISLCLGAWCGTMDARAQQVAPSVEPEPTLPTPVVPDAAAPEQTPQAEAEVAAPPQDAPDGAPDATPAPVLVEIPLPPSGYGVSAVAPPPAAAQTDNPMMPSKNNPQAWVEPGTHEHDGFFFRATLGFGGATATGDYGGTSLDVSGGGGLITLGFGKVVKENFALYGELQGLSLSEPDVSVDGEGVDNVVSTGFSSLGVGGSYYFMPLNAFVGGTLGLGTATVSVKPRDGSSRGSDNPGGNTGTGISLGAHAGKEWWVSDNWGIGIAIYGTYLSLPDGRDSTLSVIYVGLGASATYN